MASFNAETWRLRASSRFNKELAWGVPYAKATAKYEEDLKAIICLERLERWLRRRLIDVEFLPLTKGGDWARDKKRVRVNSRSRPREQYHTLLHECGHILVDGSAANTKEGKYTYGYESITDLDDPEHRRLNVKFKHRVDVLAEEIDAWHKGKTLAKRLKLPLDQEAFERSRSGALKGYVTWSLDRRVDKPDDEDEVESES